MTSPHKLPPEVEALPPKRKAFVLALVGKAAGNATEAARIAGYKTPNPEGARLLANASVQAAVDALQSPRDQEAMQDILELRAFWRAAWRGEEGFTESGRLKASEHLAKARSMFVEKHEHVVDATVRGVIAFPSVEVATREARPRSESWTSRAIEAGSEREEDDDAGRGG